MMRALGLSSPRITCSMRRLGERRLQQQQHRWQVTRVCIVGSGPSAFYTAKYILESDKFAGVHVDMLEKLPVPFGLVRYGVAPDHPEVKNVTDTFEQIAQHARFRYMGNVTVGSDVSVGALRHRYHAVVLAYGADGNRKLFPGKSYESMKGVYSAREFVNWYNGHPSYKGYSDVFQLDKVRSVVIVGHGNVALDCARILTKNVEELKKTDIADYAIEALQKSSVQNVSVIGRRGPVQAAFTIKEFRELTKLGAAVRVVADEREFEVGVGDKHSAETYESKRPVRRLTDLIKTTVGDARHRELSGEAKCIWIRFLLTPFALLPRDSACPHSPMGPMDPFKRDENGQNNSTIADVLEKDSEHSTTAAADISVGAIACAQNEFLPQERVQVAERTESLQPQGRQPSKPWEKYAAVEIIPCDLVLTAVGYQSSKIEYSQAFPDQEVLEVPFDESEHVIPNKNGRVQGGHVVDGGVHKGLLYTVGWVGRGPTGIIGTNIPDAKQTAESVITDLLAFSNYVVDTNEYCEEDPQVYITAQVALKNKEIISWDDYLAINSEEIKRGVASTPPRPRVKITDTGEMIRVAKAAPSSSVLIT